MPREITGSGPVMTICAEFRKFASEIRKLCLRPDPNQLYLFSRPVPLEGRFAIVTSAGRDAVDARNASDEGISLRTAKSCGPDASAVGVKSAEATSPMTVSNKPDHRESAYKP